MYRQMLASGPDRGNARFIPMALPKLLLNLEVILPPQTSGVPYLDRVVVYHEIHGIRGLPLEDNAIVTGELQLGCKGAPETAASVGALIGIPHRRNALDNRPPSIQHRSR